MPQYAARERIGDADRGNASSRRRLFDLSTVLVEDVRGGGGPAGIGAETFSPEFQLALPYRGFFVWHVGSDEVVGDANQALFITGGEEFRMSHPVRGGYAELIFTPADCILSDLAPATGGGLRTHALFQRRSFVDVVTVACIELSGGPWRSLRIAHAYICSGTWPSGGISPIS